MKIQREIIKKWPLQYHKNTPVHRAAIALSPSPQNWKIFDPFLLMAEDYMRKGAFDYHPHRGIETVTYMIDGELRHMDNKGNEGLLKKGDTQWLTAGKGILHLEEAPENGFANILQLWVNLPSDQKMAESRYQDILLENTPAYQKEGVTARVISGSSNGINSSTLNHAAVTMVEFTIEAGYQAVHDLPADYNGFVFILEGAGTFGADEVQGSAKEILWLSESIDKDSEITIQAQERLKFLLITGRPLREPVAGRGPFVMNTEEEVNQAFKDFRDGKFGQWITQDGRNPEV